MLLPSRSFGAASTLLCWQLWLRHKHLYKWKICLKKKKSDGMLVYKSTHHSSVLWTSVTRASVNCGCRCLIGTHMIGLGDVPKGIILMRPDRTIQNSDCPWDSSAYEGSTVAPRLSLRPYIWGCRAVVNCRRHALPWGCYSSDPANSHHQGMTSRIAVASNTFWVGNSDCYGNPWHT